MAAQIRVVSMEILESGLIEKTFCRRKRDLDDNFHMVMRERKAAWMLHTGWILVPFVEMENKKGEQIC